MRDTYDRALLSSNGTLPPLPEQSVHLYPVPSAFPSQTYVVLAYPAFVTIRVSHGNTVVTFRSSALFTPVVLHSRSDTVTVAIPDTDYICTLSV